MGCSKTHDLAIRRLHGNNRSCQAPLVGWKITLDVCALFGSLRLLSSTIKGANLARLYASRAECCLDHLLSDV